MQQFPFEEIDALYGNVILAHYKNSRHKVKIEEPEIEYDEFNPICGDQVVLQLKLNDSRVQKAGFQGQGCSISQASASMMTDLLEGRTLQEAEELSESFRKLMRGGAPSEDELLELGDLKSLEVVRKFPVRIKCALLAWTALEEGIGEYREKGTEN